MPGACPALVTPAVGGPVPPRPGQFFEGVPSRVLRVPYIRVMFSAKLAAFVLAGSLCAQDAPTTADRMTQGDRGLSRALVQALLDGAGQPAGEPGGGQATTTTGTGRVLFVVFDPTTSLQRVDLPDKLGQAMKEVADKITNTSIGVRRMTDKKNVVLDPTKDRGAVVANLKQGLSKIDKRFHDPYAEVRIVASRLAKIPGRKQILLICLDNADVEGDLEGAVTHLRKSGIQLSVITREAYISDCYWEAHSYERPPRGTRFHAADGPFIDLPWGWIFQMNSPGEVSPAGFAVYGMSRLAAATGGKAYLFSPEASSKHTCGYYAGCLFCSGDHHQLEESFWDGRVNQLAPWVGHRRDAYREIASDPAYRAIDRAWREAGRAGVISSSPSIKLGSTSASPQRQRGRSWVGVMSSLNFKSNAKKADKARAECAKVLANFNDMMSRIKPGRASKRSEAAAGLTRIELQLAIVNLVNYAAWCRDVAPGLLAQQQNPPAPPEVSTMDPVRRPVGIGYSNYSLCHGVKPYYKVNLPGGDLLRKELQELDRLYVAYEQKYGHTGYAFGLHRAGIARFHFTYPGVMGTRKRKRNKSKTKDDPTTVTERSRPVRGGSSGGRSGGATTGGGR